MCLYPSLITNPKYKKNKKNGGYIPQTKDERTLWIPIGCGVCMECKKKKTREWQVRLNEELRSNKDKAIFVTLTYSNEEYTKLLKETGLEGYEGDNAVASLSVRRWLERWRKKHKKSIRHWLCTELGGGRYEHLHMHGIIWTNESIEEIKEKWKYGGIWEGEYVNEKTINYIVKYIGKIDEKHPMYKEKILCSAGIGKNYMNRNDSKRNKFNKEENKTNEIYTTRQGMKLALPKYYRNHIYNEEEREKLWIEKLNKNERYVNGVRIDVSTKEGEENYIRAREEAQQKSLRLNYGKPENWEKKEYENNNRKLKQKERDTNTEIKGDINKAF